MTVDEKLTTILALWPEQIDIGDGFLTGHRGFYSQNLGNAWDKVKDVIGYADFELAVLEFAVYKVIHRHAMRNFGAGKGSVDVASIPRQVFLEQFTGDWERQSEDL
jgi:hypothetical protein